MTDDYKAELEHIKVLLSTYTDWHDMSSVRSLSNALDYVPGAYRKPQAGQLSLFDMEEGGEIDDD